MKYSIGIYNFLEENSSLSHSVVFFYFFESITQEGFLISVCYSFGSLNSDIYIYLLFSSLLFAYLFFTAICKASSGSHFAFLHFVSTGMVLVPVSCTMSRTSVHWSGTLSIRSSPSNLYFTV